VTAVRITCGVVVGLVAALVLGVLVASLALGADRSTPAVTLDEVPSSVPGIPAAMLAAYVGAGQRFGVDWAVLAGIGKVESDHDRSTLPGVHSGLNAYGCCAGPMQISLAGGSSSTWNRYRVDGNRDGRYDVYDPPDAAATAARYLKACGAPGDYHRALFAYNHSQAYVAQVLALAASYRAAASTSATSGPGAGTPVGSGRAGVAIAAALSQLGTPYVWGGSSPGGFDCSGLVQWAYAQAGVQLPRTTYQQWHAGPRVAANALQPGDIVFFDHVGHEGMYLGGGRYVEAPHTGDVVKTMPLDVHDGTWSGAVRPA
jgi:cell wall-associated NlpC family hydrolase